MEGIDRMIGPGDNSTDRSHSIKCVASDMCNVCISAFFGDFFFDKEMSDLNRMRDSGDNSVDKSHLIKSDASGMCTLYNVHLSAFFPFSPPCGEYFIFFGQRNQWKV